MTVKLAAVSRRHCVALARHLRLDGLLILLLLLLRRILVEVLLLLLRGERARALRRGRIHSLTLLVRALGLLVGSLLVLGRDLLLLLELTLGNVLEWLVLGLAGVGLGRHGLRLGNLRLHLVVVVGRSSRRRRGHGEAALLTALDEADDFPDEASTEEQPHQRTQTSNGGSHGKTALEQDDIALHHLFNGASAVACLAVDQTTIVNTAVHSHGHDVGSALGSHGRKGGEPEDDEQGIDYDDGDDVVGAAEADNLFGEDDVADAEPGEEGDSETEALFVEVGIVHQGGAKAEDDDGQQDLKATDDGDPEGGFKHMVVRSLFMSLLVRLLHCGRV